LSASTSPHQAANHIQSIGFPCYNYDFKTFVLVASVRHPQHVIEAALAGGDICTIAFSIFQQLVKHPLTDLGVNQLLKGWNSQLQKSPTVREGISL
jgi:transaldolase